MPSKSPAVKKIKKPQPQQETLPGSDVAGQVIITPPVFVGGMTQQGAINYIGEKIRMHREMNRKVGWTEDDIYIRHQLIIYWLSTGRPTMDVMRDMRNLWGIAQSTAGMYLKEALEYLTESSDLYRDKAREIQLARLERYAEECRVCGKYLEASKFTDQIAKLTGTYQDNKKIEVKGEGPIMISFGE